MPMKGALALLLTASAPADETNSRQTTCADRELIWLPSLSD